MPILELQKRARELGRIRIGQKGDRGQPEKLDRFRLTSASLPLIEKVAELYGGTPAPWTPAGGAEQYEVITEARRIPIMVPPQPVTQWLEVWTAGGCVHRCDGVTEVISGEPCDLGDLHEQAKPTTRLNVVLRDVEGIGVWRLESHGWNAAVELPDTAAFLAQVGGYVNGWLSLEERVSKSLVNGKPTTRRFIVPTIEIDVTPAQLMAGHGRIVPPSIEGPVQQLQIAAAPTAGEHVFSTTLDEDLAACATTEDLDRLWERRSAVAPSPEIRAAFAKRADEILNGPTPPEPTGPTHAQAWEDCVRAGGEKAWSLGDIKRTFAERNGGVTVTGATPAELVEYAAWIRSPEGEVAA